MADPRQAHPTTEAELVAGYAVDPDAAAALIVPSLAPLAARARQLGLAQARAAGSRLLIEGESAVVEMLGTEDRRGPGELVHWIVGDFVPPAWLADSERERDGDPEAVARADAMEYGVTHPRGPFPDPAELCVVPNCTRGTRASHRIYDHRFRAAEA